ncbi:hypothetical protein BDN71DRAFT_1456236 [Pleurotus eryngii]|uniref:Uncharacterized protein n=1 Tax=Pleurotus eryngii TaxID=5323 RepID=A0A9P6DB47_PLEER|nr:hypothetical protein BDN71DRAFT_1456236 [Pleurotus eryngii]
MYTNHGLAQDTDPSPGQYAAGVGVRVIIKVVMHVPAQLSTFFEQMKTFRVQPLGHSQYFPRRSTYIS